MIEGDTVNISDTDKLINLDPCQPIEEIAKQGDLLREKKLSPDNFNKFHGAKRHRAYACINLRRQNLENDSYLMEGFSTRLKYSEQRRIFRKIPGLEKVKFIRYGRIHKNTFINSPDLLDQFFSLRNDSNLYFIGAISGIDGYLPAVATGMIASYAIEMRNRKKNPKNFPKTTMLGGLSNYIIIPQDDYQPILPNYALLKPLKVNRGNTNLRYFTRSIRSLLRWKKEYERDLVSN